MLWLGLLLIGVRLFTTGQWSVIWRALSDGSTIDWSGGSGSSNNPVSVGAKSAGDLVGAGVNLATGNIHGAWSDTINSGSNIYNAYGPGNTGQSPIQKDTAPGAAGSNLIQGSVSP